MTFWGGLVIGGFVDLGGVGPGMYAFPYVNR